MSNELNTQDSMKIIARIRNSFDTKFGVPRQSGMLKGDRSIVVFEPEYRNAEALRGLEGYSHIWLLWLFSEVRVASEEEWSPTVRPPRLGGNQRVGVWATRSPFRPNHIGLSSVKLTKIERSSPEGPLLLVEGADLMNGTPIIDIKPYLPFTDSHPEAHGGFASQVMEDTKPVKVLLPKEIPMEWTREKLDVLCQVIASDPRPQYQCDHERIYTMPYDGREVKFRFVSEEEAEITGL